MEPAPGGDRPRRRELRYLAGRTARDTDGRRLSKEVPTADVELVKLDGPRDLPDVGNSQPSPELAHTNDVRGRIRTNRPGRSEGNGLDPWSRKKNHPVIGVAAWAGRRAVGIQADHECPGHSRRSYVVEHPRARAVRPRRLAVHYLAGHRRASDQAPPGSAVHLENDDDSLIVRDGLADVAMPAASAATAATAARAPAAIITACRCARRRIPLKRSGGTSGWPRVISSNSSRTHTSSDFSSISRTSRQRRPVALERRVCAQLGERLGGLALHRPDRDSE